jgi:hypothetical protein
MVDLLGSRVVLDSNEFLIDSLPNHLLIFVVIDRGYIFIMNVILSAYLVDYFPSQKIVFVDSGSGCLYPFFGRVGKTLCSCFLKVETGFH